MICQKKNGVCPIDDSGLCCGGFKVVACIPTHGRLPLLKHTIERLYNKNGVYKVICVGDHEEKTFCESLGAEFIQVKNKPLGRKWNTAFAAAQKYNPDACLFIGSSDWISDNWLTEMEPYTKQYDLVGMPGCYFLHVGNEDNRLCHWPGYVGPRKGESIGIGRLISRSLMDKINWRPFNDALDSSLDRSMIDKVNSVNGTIFNVVSDKIFSVSISTDQWVNLHKFEMHWNNILPSKKIFEVDNFLNQHFPEAYQIFNHAMSYKQ
jgi:hypothetical protein